MVCNLSNWKKGLPEPSKCLYKLKEFVSWRYEEAELQAVFDAIGSIRESSP